MMVQPKVLSNAGKPSAKPAQKESSSEEDSSDEESSGEDEPAKTPKKKVYLPSNIHKYFSFD